MKTIWKCMSLILILSLTLLLAACTAATTGTTSTGTTATAATTSSSTATQDPFLSGEKPELNLLTRYKPFNMEEQPSYKVIEEMTGYKIKWFMLPESNANEKLLLEISGGTSYDLITQVLGGVDQLNSQNALLDLTPYLDKYGPNIYAAIPDDMALAAITDASGRIYCLRNAIVDEPVRGENSYGTFKGGIGFNTSYLTSLNMNVPTNLDDFYQTLKAYTDSTGKAALTQASAGWNVYILAAFGMGNPSWYDLNGVFTHRIRHPGTVAYLTFMQKIYREGLLDNDFPVNTAASAKEKFVNGTAMAYPVNFWDIDGIYSAFASVGLDAKVKVATFLAPNASTAPVHFINQGVGNVTFIPKTAKNPEHAIIYFNMISDPDNYRRIYIGTEGITYEVKDGNYYPLFPAFNDHLNADMFVGVQFPGELFKMWQARARKTEAMAEIHAQMNERIDQYTIRYSYESYAGSLEIVQKNAASLNIMVNDALIQAIVSGEDAQQVMSKIITEWNKMGGQEYEQAMVEWYEANKSKFQ